MSDTVTVNVKGLKELQDVLTELPKRVSTRVLRTDLKAAADYLVQETVAAAPEKTGFLASHFDSRVRIKSDAVAGSAFIGPEGKMYYPHAGVSKEGRRGPEEEWRRVATGKFAVKGGLVPVVSVARFLEFGTSRMPAHPFMTQAFENSKDAILVKIIEGIKSALSGLLRP